jgi:UV DNA damage endonuclease
LNRLSELCVHNAESLQKSLVFCCENGIGDFRINSQILPLKTHPDVGYDLFDLPGAEDIVSGFKACGEFCLAHDIRTTFHPDQFIILSLPDPGVVQRSIADLVNQAQVAEWVNADVINIHLLSNSFELLAGLVPGNSPAGSLSSQIIASDCPRHHLNIFIFEV